MNELDSFTINFITNGLDKLQDGIKDLRTQMDSLEQTFEKGTSKGESFFSKFGGWLSGLTALAAGFLSIRDAINSTFNVSDKIIDLNLTADRVGRTALEVETLSRALLHFSTETDVGRMFGEAEGLYKALNTITGKAWRLQFGGSLMEELNRAGGIIFTGEESDQEMISKIIQGLEYHTQRQDWYSRSQLANVLGISETAAAFLGSGENAVNAILKNEAGKAHLYTDSNREAAINLHEARVQLKDTWDKIYEQLQPKITEFIEKFNILLEKLRPIVNVLIGAFGWIMEKFGWLLDKGEEIGNKIGDAIGSGLEKVRESKSKAGSKFAYDRLKNFIDGKEEYAGVADLLTDIASVKDNIGSAIKETPESKRILELASERAREMANVKLIQAGMKPIKTSNSNIVNVENINITGMGDSAAIDTKNALGKRLGEVQPAWNGMGDL